MANFVKIKQDGLEGYFERVERLDVRTSLTFFNVRKPSDEEIQEDKYNAIRFSWGEDNYVKWDELLQELLILTKRKIVYSFAQKGDVIEVALMTEFVEEIK